MASSSRALKSYTAVMSFKTSYLIIRLLFFSQPTEAGRSGVHGHRVLRPVTEARHSDTDTAATHRQRTTAPIVMAYRWRVWHAILVLAMVRLYIEALITSYEYNWPLTFPTFLFFFDLDIPDPNQGLYSHMSLRPPYICYWYFNSSIHQNRYHFKTSYL